MGEQEKLGEKVETSAKRVGCALMQALVIGALAGAISIGGLVWLLTR